MSQNKETHIGHRARLKKQFLQYGIQNLLPHQILELLLFYPVPRKDTNPMAHALIDHFGSAFRALRASEEELGTIDGIGVHTAHFFRDLSLFVESAIDESSEVLPLPTEKECQKKLNSLLSNLFQNEHRDVSLLLTFDNAFDLIDSTVVADGPLYSARIQSKQLIKKALDDHAASVVLAHHAHNTLAVPTESDRNIALILQDDFRLTGIELRGFFLVANHRALDLLSSSVSMLNCEESPRSASADFKKKEEEKLVKQRQVLSRLLSYSSTYQKAEQMAEELTSACPSLQKLCMQRINWLQNIGLTENSAILLRLAIPAYAECLLKSRLHTPMTTADDIAACLMYTYPTHPNESLCLLLFDENLCLISVQHMQEGTVNTLDIPMRRICETAHFNRAHYAVVAHNHPRGAASPSDHDIQATFALARALETVDCTLLEHFIISGKTFCPLLRLMMKENCPGMDLPNFYKSSSK